MRRWVAAQVRNKVVRVGECWVISPMRSPTRRFGSSNGLFVCFCTVFEPSRFTPFFFNVS